MKNYKKQKSVLILILLFVALGLRILLTPIYATELKFNTENSDQLYVGEENCVNLSVDTQDDTINAIGGRIKILQGILDVRRIETGSSVITLWIDKPRKDGNNIQFSGIVPGGFEGKEGKILSFCVIPQQEGKVEFITENIQAYLNDGSGKVIEVTEASLTSFVSSGPKKLNSLIDQDIDPPEDFDLIVTREKYLYANRWTLLFNGQDKGSGINRFEVLENKKKELKSGDWHPGTSPYLLEDQSLGSWIFVKAIDNYGNELIKSLPPKVIENKFPIYEIYAIVILDILAIYLLFTYLKYRRRSLSRREQVLS